MKTLGAAVLCAALLTACQSNGKRSPITGEVPPPPQFMDAVQSCVATKAKFVLGQVMTLPLLEEAKTRSGSGQARTVLPDSTAALPFEINRLLVDVDRAGRARALRCG